MRTELPKKWCVENPRNEESQLLYGYASNSTGRNYYDGDYFHFPDYAHDCCTSSIVREGYIEITFEEFKALVLREKPSELQYEIY